MRFQSLDRGKTFNGKQVYGFYYAKLLSSKGITKHYIKTVSKNGRLGRSKTIDPKTRCRCTGQRDMLGKLIFQGDIVISQVGGQVIEIRYGEHDAYCPVDQSWMRNIGFFATSDGYPEMPIGNLYEYAVKMGDIFMDVDEFFENRIGHVLRNCEKKEEISLETLEQWVDERRKENGDK